MNLGIIHQYDNIPQALIFFVQKSSNVVQCIQVFGQIEVNQLQQKLFTRFEIIVNLRQPGIGLLSNFVYSRNVILESYLVCFIVAMLSFS